MKVLPSNNDQREINAIKQRNKPTRWCEFCQDHMPKGHDCYTAHLAEPEATIAAYCKLRRSLPMEKRFGVESPELQTLRSRLPFYDDSINRLDVEVDTEENLDIDLNWGNGKADCAEVGAVSIRAYQSDALLTVEEEEFGGAEASLSVDELRRLATACEVLADRLEARAKAAPDAV
jgi:hypothetical protein